MSTSRGAVVLGVLLAVLPCAPAPEARRQADIGGIDELVLAHLDRLGLVPAAVASDGVFVRRVYLDAIGTLPTAAEARGFIDDPDPDKRSRLIDRLLEREAFADYWAMKWSDVLRVKSEFPINLWPNAVQAYHRWIRTAIRDEMPYDRFARALLTGSGSNFRAPPVNFYRAVQSREPEALAAAVALTFMGARTDRWPDDRRRAMAGFFSAVGYKRTGEWKEEIVFFDPARAPTTSLRLPDGTVVRLAPGQDPREVFATWLVAPDNPWFAPAVANRAWAWLLGRGLVHEPDDLRPDNPPSHPELLAHLARELVSARYDLKHLYRLILNSATYQRAAFDPEASAGTRASFARYQVRPLDAEVLLDAINQVTGATDEYASAIPEPFTFMPEGQRAIAIADGSITSAFLETFGRPARDTGLDAERNPTPTAAARLYLLNSSHMQRKIEASARLRGLVDGRHTPDEAVTALYLTILSRYPTDAERQAASTYPRVSGADRRTAGLDLAWALINSAEFQFRH